ncbi:MAG: cation-translocating P-type ATPase [Saprospiraceae bacterium]
MEDQSDLIQLKVDGMTCNGCAQTIEKYLKKNQLQNIHINFVDGEVEFKPFKNLDVERIIKGIDDLGYKVMNRPGMKATWSMPLRTKLIIALICTLPLIFHHIFPSWFIWLHSPLIQFVLCLPAVGIGLWTYLPGAFKSSLAGMPNMDVTICLGAIAALVYSIIGWAMGNPEMIFFETAASILTLVLLGKYLEHKAVQQTTSAIDALKKLAVEYGKMQMPSGTVVKIPINEISKGDLLIVAEGDAVPLDGKIIAGEGLLDEGWVSGESKAIKKKTGDQVIGASQVLSGNFTMQVQSIGHETVLGRIIALVKEASHHKAPIQTLADKISAIFVPSILAISVITFLVNYFGFDIDLSHSFLRSIAVLVISCPCAMGLATPTAIMVGLGKAMKNGVLIKGASTLEILGNIKNIILDKTGTITVPHVKIEYTRDQDQMSIEQTNQAIYTIESKSSHPIAKSIMATLGKVSKTQNDFVVTENKGLGITGIDRDKNEWKINWSIETGNIIVEKNGDRKATLYIEDGIKPDADKFVRFLRRENIKPYLISGDDMERVKQVATQLQILDWQGRVMPDQKAKMVDPIKATGVTVMVGDGINDAVALSRADLGISFSEASHAAVQSSQVVLLNDNLDTLAKAITVARQTLSTIKQNLGWAFSYNIIAIPLAAMGYLSPMWGAAFMAFSDLVVVGNSLRIRWTKN